MFNVEPIIKVLAKPFGTAPGWALLLLSSFWLVDAGHLQRLAEERFGFREPKIPGTVWALALTLIFYKIGDWLDEVVYKKRVAVPDPSSPRQRYIKCNRFDPEWVDRERMAARDALKIQEGSYRVAMALIIAAEKSAAVRFANELGKFFRSLVVPFLLVAIFGFWVSSLKGRAVFLFSAITILFFYVLLKQFHIWLLYRRVRQVTADERFESGKMGARAGSTEEPPGCGGKLLYFSWDGKFLETASPDKPDPCRPKELRDPSDETTEFGLPADKADATDAIQRSAPVDAADP